MGLGVCERLGDVLLVGLGASTRAAAEYLLPLVGTRVTSLTLYPGTAGSHGELPEGVCAQAEGLAARGVRVVWGTQQVEGRFDVGVMSPGIPEVGAFFASARAACARLVSDPELAFCESPRDWVAITGTNGKTTTTTLTRDLLRAGGRAARAVGNIGLPPIACLADRASGEVFVAELSSFQLACTEELRPRVAVLLNVTPDHLEWHGTLEAYAEAKARVFANLGAEDLAILGCDETCARLAQGLSARGVRVARLGVAPEAGEPDAAWADAEGRLRVRLRGAEHALCRFAEMRLAGAHNLQNALAAATCALEMGVADADVTRGLLAFAPLAHRIEPCGEVGGVRFFDDSKATNVDATVQAVSAFEAGRLVVLLGGHDKGTDLAQVAQACVERARVAVCYGEAGPRLREALRAAGACDEPREGTCAALAAKGMREAFACAADLACPGEVVLLSPACSSFDEFGGYAERGDVFQALVADLSKRRA